MFSLPIEFSFDSYLGSIAALMLPFITIAIAIMAFRIIRDIWYSAK
ncbi:MAG: hypothetical protein HQL10_13990 [Nitrospirae bacterium]|nr:hypothetical protein [Nitrospirota bacterium]